MASHILWQNAGKTVTLIDIPRSIVEAQGFNSPAEHNLLSSNPREIPYPSSEPKSAKARAKLVGNTVDDEVHIAYRELLIEALQEVKRCHSEDWCLPRLFVVETQPPPKKRKLDEAEGAGCPHVEAIEKALDSAAQHLPNHYLSSMARLPTQAGQPLLQLAGSPPQEYHSHEVGRTAPHFFSNDSDKHIVVSPSEPDKTGAEAFNFHIPPNSSLYLGNCTASYAFRKAIREHARQQGVRSTFDFILLDPPWPNRSIKRTHKTAGATYNTVPTLYELGELILDMQLDSMMAGDALVGVWITNKQAIRELVLGAGGFFECWGVDLIEEWIWLKTTISGEPTSVLHSTWKKPYEVLLLGRKRRKDANDAVASPIKRKFIIGVPDLHSRKPCLKSLIEPMMPDREKYTALEVFARHLVAGWCSWGDECIKFNWDGYWSK